MLKLKLQYFGHPMGRADLLKNPLMLGKFEGKRRRAVEDEMVRLYNQLNTHESEQILGDDEGQGSLECWTSWGHKESDMT